MNTFHTIFFKIGVVKVLNILHNLLNVFQITTFEKKKNPSNWAPSIIDCSTKQWLYIIISETERADFGKYIKVQQLKMVAILL